MSEITKIIAREVLDSRGNRYNPFTKSIDGKEYKDYIAQKRANSPMIRGVFI